MSDAQQSGKPVNMTVGALGEQAAADWYAAHGYSVEARNVHESHNELDLIAADAQSLVFVEVKTRTMRRGSASRYGRPADAVDKSKRQRTVQAAEAYLRAHPTSLLPRIDVCEVYLTKKPDGTRAVADIVVFRNAVKAR